MTAPTLRFAWLPLFVVPLLLAACGDTGPGLEAGDAAYFSDAPDVVRDAPDVADAVPDVADTAPDVADVGQDIDAGPAPIEWTQPPAWCTDEAPDLDCFVLARDAFSDNITLAVEIADKFMQEHEPTALAWDWPDAVMLVGMARLARITQDPRYYAYIEAYVLHHYEIGYRLTTPDTASATALVIELMAAGYDHPAYQEIVDDVLFFYAEESERTEEGGLSHFGKLPLGPELWADSLFMFGNIFTRWGEYSGDVDILNVYTDQVRIFSELMQEESGFYKHAADSAFDQEDDVYWARANGWILAALFDHLSVRQDDGEVPAVVYHSVVALADAVMAAQDPETGLWSTVVNRPGETYFETSASALYAFGLARGYRYGILGDDALDAAERAIQGVIDQIERDDQGRPVVTGISGPTNVGTFDYYAGIEVDEDIPYGLGAVLLGLTETSGLGMELEVNAPGAPGAESEVALADIETRRAAYFDDCAANNGTGNSVYGQSCRIVAGETESQQAIDNALAKLAAREDTSDFTANGLVRMLYLNEEYGTLSEDNRAAIEQTLLDFKYWLTEPGEDGMSYWTENHQILYHSAEYLIGQMYPDAVFSNSGMTGQEHMDHARPRILRWMHMRGMYGFSEWHSNVYFNEDIPPLLNLYDFADDPELVAGAEVILDLLTIDLATNSYQGIFATTAGRTSASKFVRDTQDSTREYTHIVFGASEVRSFGNFSGAFMATSDYTPPALVTELVTRTAPGGENETFEHKQRDSWSVEEGPRIGVGYEGIDNVVLWAGQSTLTHPDMINPAFAALDEHDLFGGFLFDSFPPSVLSLLQSLAGTPGLPNLARNLEPVAMGLGLETIDTYVYRTPDYQLATAMDWKPGLWSAQTLIFRATLSEDVSITTWGTGVLGGDLVGDDPPLSNSWVGGWMPRVTAHENVAIMQYNGQDWDAVVDQVVNQEAVRVMFPTDLMDEWQAAGDWLFGRVGDGYVALYASRPLTQSETSPESWVSDSIAGVYIVEMGRAETHGTFAEFVATFDTATVALTADGDAQDIVYTSPTLGEMAVGWTGPMTIAGEPADVGPFDRMDNAYVTQRRGQSYMDVTVDDAVLRLDFDAFTRTQFDVSAP